MLGDGAARAGSCTILLVEDQPLRRALGRLLAWEGFRVVSDVSEGRAERPVLIVLDLGTGCAKRALAQLRSVPDGERLPLLVLGGDTTIHGELRGRRGSTTILPPLVDVPQILAAVRAGLAELAPPSTAAGLERERVRIPLSAR